MFHARSLGQGAFVARRASAMGAHTAQRASSAKPASAALVGLASSSELQLEHLAAVAQRPLKRHLLLVRARSLRRGRFVAGRPPRAPTWTVNRPHHFAACARLAP